MPAFNWVHVTAGLGAGAKPEMGKSAAEESIEEVMDRLAGSNMVFIRLVWAVVRGREPHRLLRQGMPRFWYSDGGRCDQTIPFRRHTPYAPSRIRDRANSGLCGYADCLFQTKICSAWRMKKRHLPMRSAWPILSCNRVFVV